MVEHGDTKMCLGERCYPDTYLEAPLLDSLGMISSSRWI